ncbi:MAG: hypothetical protein ACT4UQ_00710 [Gammaproteobacteria bacterium]
MSSAARGACYALIAALLPAPALLALRFKDGPPARATYELELALRRPGMAIAGFQLAIRNDGDGTRAGELAIPQAEESHTALLAERGVQFVQHRLARSAAAGDGDESQAGDYVYTLEAVSAAG